MVLKKSFIIISVVFIINILDMGVLFIAVRTFRPEEFGYLTIANSLSAFLLFFSDLNFHNVNIKKMGEKKRSKNEYFSTYFFLKSILLFGTLLIISFIIVVQINIGFIKNPLQFYIIVIIFLTAIFNSVYQVYSSCFHSSMEIEKFYFANLSDRLIESILALLLFTIFFLY